MKKLIDTKEFGKVVAVEYRNPQSVGGAQMLSLTKWLPEGTQVRVIILESSAIRTKLIIEKVNPL